MAATRPPLLLRATGLLDLLLLLLLLPPCDPRPLGRILISPIRRALAAVCKIGRVFAARFLRAATLETSSKVAARVAAVIGTRRLLRC